MANEEHVKLLKAGVEGWNEWRDRCAERPDLRDVNLSNADLSRANFHDATLRGAHLADARLFHANLLGANLNRSDLRGANLGRANLTGANLGYANLRGANLGHANLLKANLFGVYLHRADLSRANLNSAELGGAFCSNSTFVEVDLSQPFGLGEVIHIGPSSIGTDTLERTAASLTKNRSRQGEVEVFLRGAGVNEHILEIFRAVMIGGSIEFYSCFISYTHTDKAFARRLYDALQGKGIRCWLDEKELRPGDHILDEIDRGIRLWDKIIIVCSEASLGFSPWVEAETGLAIQKEKQLGKQEGKPVRVLIPLNLDGYLFSEHCTGGNISVLRGRLAADFTNWESDNAKFEEEFEKVVEALRT